MNHVVGLVSNILILVAILLIGRKLLPYFECFCAKHGMEDLYGRCEGIIPALIVFGIIYSVVGFVLNLALKGIVH